MTNNKMVKYNKLELVEMTAPRIRINGRKRKRAIFKCDCGSVREYDFSSVKTGHRYQCPECSKISSAKSRKTHGLVKHTLYRKWQDMKNRCRNPNRSKYKNYGGRGISVCKEWNNSFEVFFNWSINNGWYKGLTIDRIDIDGNYCPSNCRYITMLEQSFNKTNTFFVEINDKKYSLSKLLYLNEKSNRYSNIWRGLKIGKDIEHYIEKYSLNVANEFIYNENIDYTIPFVNPN